MRDKAQRHAIAPQHAPPCCDSFKLGRKPHSAHTASRISTTGTLGASPAAKDTPQISRRSSAKRTGTSKRKPALITALKAGGVAKVTIPPASSDHPVAGPPL